MVDKTSLELRSLVKQDGTLELSLSQVSVPSPTADEVIVRVEATPINPSDLAVLLSAADASAAQAKGTGAQTITTAPVPSRAFGALSGRVGKSLTAGLEGAGVVVDAGASPQAKALVGKTVATFGSAMYTQYRKVRVADCLVLPDHVTARDGASAFVNPLTTLGMIETMRREGHKALVHTAAASNLGQMLVRLCKAEGVPLVNVVRNDEQSAMLRELGAEHVVSSAQPSFREDLVAALKATGATMAFDAIGGGKLASQILTAMETVAISSGDPTLSRYGSNVRKQLYIYGGLDLGITELARNFGFSWGLGGWLLNNFLRKVGAEVEERLKARVASEITSTFASHYTRTISLSQALDPAVIAGYSRKATGEKFLINPSLPV